MKEDERNRIIVGTVICGGALVIVAVIVILAWRFGCYAVVCCQCCAAGSLYKADADVPPPVHPRRSLGSNVLDGDDLVDKEDVVGVRVEVEASTETTPNHSFPQTTHDRLV